MTPPPHIPGEGIALLTNIKNGEIYEWLGGNAYKNLTTGKAGEITLAQAQKFLAVHDDLCRMVNKWPIIYKLICKSKCQMII